MSYLYKGTPSPTTINVPPDTSEGTSLDLTCTATSNAHPKGTQTGLDMYYSWTVDNTNIITDTEYTVGGTNSDTLTIKNLQKNDINKQFVCKSKEGDQSQEGVSLSETIDVQCKSLFYSVSTK